MKNKSEIYQFMLNNCENCDNPKALLKDLLEFDNFLYSKISSAAVKYGNGVHPKHRVTDYHSFFTHYVDKHESVIDLGSGLGDVAHDVAKVTDNEVVGLEINRRNVAEAKRRYQRDNLTFVRGDICKDIPEKRFDVVILSNVLEHLDNRVELLKSIVSRVSPRHILLRIPHFEREWMVPVKKELGVSYLLDRTHKIEYTYKEFREEMYDANLIIDFDVVNWGEIWAVCSPIRSCK